MQRLEFEARLQYENEYQPALTQESLDDLERRLQQEVKVGIGLFHMLPHAPEMLLEWFSCLSVAIEQVHMLP